MAQETLNYWKQLPHILKYFRAEEEPNARRPQNFMTGFLEVCPTAVAQWYLLTHSLGQELSVHRRSIACTYPNESQTDSMFSVPYAVQCIAFIPMPHSSHTSIRLLKLSLSSWNLSATTSHKSIRSLNPFSSASTDVVPSTRLSDLPTFSFACN